MIPIESERDRSYHRRFRDYHYDRERSSRPLDDPSYIQAQQRPDQPLPHHHHGYDGRRDYDSRDPNSRPLSDRDHPRQDLRFSRSK